MGTERTLEYKSVCRCGLGTFLIEDCSPDHGWSGSARQWYESRIDCPTCGSLYEIQRRSRSFVLVSRVVLREREAIRHDAYERGEALMQTNAVTDVLKSLEDLLAKQRSAAAVFRLVRRARLTHDLTEGTFRRHWSTPKYWIRGNITVGHLRAVLALLKVSPTTVVEPLAQIEALSERAGAPIEPVGEPIYTLQTAGDA